MFVTHIVNLSKVTLYLRISYGFAYHQISIKNKLSHDYTCNNYLTTISPY